MAGLQEAEFLRDVEKHEMLVLRDDGIYRHIRFKELSAEEKAALVKEQPAYGRVICRCETITEGEILAALHSEVPANTIDGVKRRAGAGMGRCQGGFGGPRVLANMAFNLGIHGLLKFVRTLNAIERGNYDEAASHMLASKWAGQVGQRAQRLAAMMRGE